MAELYVGDIWAIFAGYPNLLRRWCHPLSLPNFHFQGVERLNPISLSSSSRLRNLTRHWDSVKIHLRAWITLDLHIIGACQCLGSSFCWGYLTTIWPRCRLRWNESVSKLLRSWNRARNQLWRTHTDRSQKWWFFSRKHGSLQVSVRLGQAVLRNVTEFKYLGIIFDRKLT
jgi:hypothetical protein